VPVAAQDHRRPAVGPWRARLLAIAFGTIAAAGPGVAAGAASATTTPHPVVVQRLVEAFDGSTMEGVEGPRTLTVRLDQPTTRGDLLIAAIDDGVVTSGMVHPHYLFGGWDLGVTTIGGETADNGAGPYRTGGLQASIYFLPDNPGGIESIPIARIPKGTQATVTVTIAELSGAPEGLRVDATGTSTSGPTVADYTQRSSVSTTTEVSDPPDLVVALFNNGGNAPGGEHYVTPRGWTLLGENTTPNNYDQPILANFEVVSRPSVITEREQYQGGYAIDNCAVIVAFAEG
jgi:hypothetical protein